MLTFVRDLTPLHPILSDGDWRFDLSFYGAGVDDPMSFPEGTTFSAVFALAGRRQPADADVHEITLDAGQIALVDGFVVSLALDAVADGLADWTPGTYELELRAVYPDGGGTDPLYGVKVTLARGLSHASELGGVGPGGLPGGQAGARGILTAGGERVVVYGEAAGQVSKAQALLDGLKPHHMTSAFTAVAGILYTLDSSGGAFSVTLPASPSPDDEFRFRDRVGACAAHPVTLLTTALTVEGEAVDWAVEMDFDAVALTWSGSTLIPYED